ncbi:putative C6 transcription factor [Annulohypoxylon maeteangense]|uniref:putative C6 transcription factor n=1 Tax=Annulohypoxylon maeteangense TaxID=1927788 RepID=UPI0020072376|nr:putative C6 transcription factor [Annulohypoxylon maeteangense]KAI0884899.1 putative C6 transcription factor [Annulohypoxylon maeteangense]
MADPERRRRRPPVRRKLRCSRESPCSNCVKSRSGSCVYENFISHPQQRAELGLGVRHRESQYLAPINSVSSTATATTVANNTSQSSPKAASSTTGSTSASHSSQEVESLRSRIKQLEEQLSKINLAPSQPPVPLSDSNIEIIDSRISGTFYIHHEDDFTGQPRAISRSVTHKTRVFGQSHWITGFSLVRDIIGIFEPYVRDESSKISVLMQKSKCLARSIKDRRSAQWPSPPVADLPSKDVADELVNHYFRTVEPVYRILHIPTFKRDYEAHWVSTSSEPNIPFLVQLKLVLAIGATTYDELFSLKASAIGWVFEAQTWISEPGFKHRLNLQYIQTNILLLIAREFVDVGPDLVWISAGTLLRTAIYMGLHKDPKRLPKMSIFAAEMRRRLWNTILELSTQLSLTSGGPPFISLDSFDTEPPGNFDDEQITADNPVPKPETSFTQMSTAIALRTMFATRLSITKFLNDHNSRGTYGETLRLDAELRTAYKSVLRLLRGYKSGPGLRPSEFEVDMVSLLMNRYILSLHNPYFNPATQEAAYAFSRKVIIESSLKVWRTMYPSSTTMSFQTSKETEMPPSKQRDLPRLAICASGFFRIITLQASVLIAMELMTQLQEEDILGPGLIRQDLLTIMEEAKTWSWMTIEAGETSIKGYFLASLLAAHVEGRLQGLEKDDLRKFLVKVIEEAEEKCIPKLEEMLARYQTKNAVEELEQSHSTSEPQPLGDWDFSMSDALFDFSNPEPINWVFDEASQDPLLWS